MRGTYNPRLQGSSVFRAAPYLLARFLNANRCLLRSKARLRSLNQGHRFTGYSVISLHGGGSPEVMKREIWRNYPIGEKVQVVEQLLDRGVLAGGRRVSKPPSRCCATGCEMPTLPEAAE